MKHKLRSIQVLRGVAATAVIVHHAYRYVDPNSFARVGSAGVDLFFVISGFIMATIAADKRPGEFLFDRFWRIFPMWWIASAMWLLAVPHDPATIRTSLTLWPIFTGTFHPPAPLLGWTLCFEVLFYAAFALGLATRAWLPVAGFALALAIGPRSALLCYLGSPMILEFLAGVVIAGLPRHKLGAFLIPVGVAIFAVAPVNYYTEIFGVGSLIRVTTWGSAAALIVYGARSIEESFEARAFDIPVLVGNASYSIYLFHRLVVLGKFAWPAEIAAALALGIAVHFGIERRIMRLKPRLARPHPRLRDRIEARGSVEV
jgi:exopolysaccharide production protein ExoZ